MCRTVQRNSGIDGRTLGVAGAVRRRLRAGGGWLFRPACHGRVSGPRHDIDLVVDVPLEVDTLTLRRLQALGLLLKVGALARCVGRWFSAAHRARPAVLAAPCQGGHACRAGNDRAKAFRQALEALDVYLHASTRRGPRRNPCLRPLVPLKAMDNVAPAACGQRFSPCRMGCLRQQRRCPGVYCAGAFQPL